MKISLSQFSPLAPKNYVYMLQLVEYEAGKFLRWFMLMPNLRKISKRDNLKWTKKARVLWMISTGVYTLFLVTALVAVIWEMYLQAAVIVLAMPFINALVLAVTVSTGAKLLDIVRWPLLGQTRKILSQHSAVKIAVLGSYGKTTMKELLHTVLSEAKTVKSTPGNMNVPISHARWVTRRIEADEDVIIFEYGEGRPGDIRRFAKLTMPNYAVITGLAPNHLDHYKDLNALSDDLASITEFVPTERILVNGEAKSLVQRISKARTYDQKSAADWKIDSIKVDYEGTGFVMTKGSAKLHIKSRLLGKHQVGPLAAVAALAHELGLNQGQIESGFKKTQAFEHRMQPRHLHGAWIIDDTYNGNLEGVRAGLELLKDLHAKRKTYVTPGLVDQGVETERVHREFGKLIAAAKPDKVVLMKNSVTRYMKEELEAASYSGELIIEDEPLNYYTNLEHTLAAGDLVVLQNDWTDNYF